MDEKDIETLHAAKQAVLAMDLFKPYLEKEKAAVLAKIKNLFRSDKHDLSSYLGLISTLVSLDDLEAKMLKQIKAGQPISEKVMTINGR